MSKLRVALRLADEISGPLASIINQFSSLEQSFQKAAAQQEKVNGAVEQGQGIVGLLDKGIRSVIDKYVSLESLQSGMKLSDDYMNSINRINAINDNLQTSQQLQDKIFAAAERSRGSYSDMLAIVGKFSAADAFKSNDEGIAFAELMQKSFRLGGTGMEDQKTGMDELAGAMSEGKLEGDGFQSILENAPMIANAISEFTGKSESELQTMADTGALTADIIKNAMFAASGDINSSFAGMPMSFGDYVTQMRNIALQSFGPVIEQISQLINSPAGEQFMQGFGSAIAFAAQLAGQLLTAVSNVVGFISENMPIIEPILWGLVAAMGSLWLITQMVNIVQLILNATMKANIYVLIISLVIGLIVWLVKLWQTNDQFAAGLMRAWNSILNFFGQFEGFFWGLVEVLLIPFVWLTGKVGGLFDKVLEKIAKDVNPILDVINQITGTNYQIDTTFDTEKFTKDLQAYAKARKDDAFAKAADAAAKREDQVKKAINDRQKERAEKEVDKAGPDYGKLGTDYESLSKTGAGTGIGAATGTIPKVGEVGEVGKINNTVDISSEDIEMMRNIAEMNAIQNFVTLTPTVQVTTGPISKDVDVDEVIRRIGSTMEQEIQSSAQGAYG
ncbi:tape measure protein [Paenibacillus glycanilyticus]|uniref:tape measure protein n=1 Tax=Paenibacillus glycanilyticus TaxID=126569 RepID=UPI00190FD18E|nr:tape measure protein [Paenibacillus glycanilyticus]